MLCTCMAAVLMNCRRRKPQGFLGVRVAFRSALQELARGIGFGVALWAQSCPPCSPTLHCPPVPSVWCDCHPPSALAVAGAVGLLALVAALGFLAGALWQRQAPVGAVGRDAPRSGEVVFEELARAQAALVRRRQQAIQAHGDAGGR